ITSGKWDEFLDALPAHRRQFVLDWVEEQRAAGRVATRGEDGTIPATGPGNWRRHEQMQSFIRWHWAVTGKVVEGKDTLRLRWRALRLIASDAKIVAGERLTQLALWWKERDGLRPAEDAAALGVNYTPEAIVATQQVDIVTGTKAHGPDRRDWMNKVLDDVDGTQREAVETERRIGELRKELRKKFRINFAIGVGLMATGAWFAWFGPLPELVPAGVFAMSNSLAFIVRGLLT